MPLPTNQKSVLTKFILGNNPDQQHQPGEAPFVLSQLTCAWGWVIPENFI